MDGSDCQGISSRLSAVGKLYSSVFDGFGNRSQITQNGRSGSSPAMLSCSIPFDKLSSFEAMLDSISKPQVEDETTLSRNQNGCTQKDQNSGPLCAQACAFIPYSFHLGQKCIDFCPSKDREIDLQFALLSETTLTAKTTAKSKTAEPLNFNPKCPYFHASQKDWIDVYFGSISHLLSDSDLNWISNPSIRDLKLWTSHECFLGGGLGYSSMAIKCFGGSHMEKLYSSEHERLNQFIGKYYKGQEEEALSLILSSSSQKNFVDMLSQEMNRTDFIHFSPEPPIISLAALLLNHNFNHECFQAISFFISSIFPIEASSDTPISDLIVQIIEKLYDPIERHIFTNIQKCLALLLLMAGRPLLALDCLVSALNATSTLDPILLSRIAALIRITKLASEGNNPQIKDITAQDVAVADNYWKSIKPKLELYLSHHTETFFKPAKLNYELLLYLEEVEGL